MDLGLPLGEIAILLAGGALTGLLSGLFGIGGGGVLVPVLYELFGLLGVDEALRMHLTVGTSFAVIIPTTLRSAYAHYRRGAVDTKLLMTLGPAVATGVLLGTLTAKASGDVTLKLIWVFAASLLSLNYLFRKESWCIAPQMPPPTVIFPVGAGIGFLSSMMGIGGTAYVAPFMTVFGRPMHQAVGTGAACALFVAVPAAFGYVWAGWSVPGLPPASFGFVNLMGAAVIIPVSVLTAPLGVRLAHGLSRRNLERAFGVFLAFVALRFALALA